MTVTEFYTFAENWYQRTHRLRLVWQDSDETERRRLKAFYLWSIMKERVIKLMAVVRGLQPKPNYLKGSDGLISGDRAEIILDRKDLI